MFERQVTTLLTQLLGNYVEPSCFRHDKVNVGVWSGYVVLQHLELQRKIYPHLGVAVVRGVLGQITIKIPWNRLVYDSVLVTIDDVYILLRNVNREDLVPPTAELEQILKKKLIEELYQAKLDTDNQNGDDSFLVRLRTKILDNLEFHIRRIHIRFQDPTSGDHPFTLGLTMESLHAQSTDSNWQPSYVDASTSKEPMIYKSFELNHLSLYLNPDCALQGYELFDGEKCSLEQFTEAFSRSIPKRMDLNMPPQTPLGDTKHNYILKPINASAHLKMKRNCNDNQPSVPNMELQVLVDEVALQLEESQYCDLLFLLTALKTAQHAKIYEKYHRYRPKRSVFQAPRAWWQYAIKCIQSDVEKKQMGWSWIYMKERRDDRAQYVTMWQKLQLASMPEHFLGEEQTQALEHDLESIEARRSAEDVLLFRYLADIELKKQHSIVATATPAAASTYSFWNYVRWSGSNTDAAKVESGEEMERQELYRILGYDPSEKAVATQEYSVISFQLNQGSITLLNDPDTKHLRNSSIYSRSYSPQPFFTALFAHVHTDIVKMSENDTKMELSLQTMELYDESMDGHCILKRRVPMSSLNVEITMLTPIFRMSYESMAGKDQMLKLFMEPLEIIYSPTALCWMHLSTFSTAPEALGLWAEMEIQALNELVNFKARTEAKVEYAMANRIPIAVDVRIQAPVVILPASDTDMHQCARLILDLGHVHFRTERLSNLNVDVASSHSRKPASIYMANSTTFAKQLTDEAENGEGATRWKEEFYDKFTCTMSNLHVMLLPPAVPYSAELLMHSTTPFSLVDPFHINITMRKSVLPLDATLYQLYVHADLPALSLHLSIGQYQHLSKVLGRFKTSPETPPRVTQLVTPRFPTHQTTVLNDNYEENEDTQSMMSDDTWFSVENANEVVDDTDLEERVSIPPVIVQSVNPLANQTHQVSPEVVKTVKISRKVLDRRVCVCTVTIPIIQIHFQKAEDEAVGRVTCLVEGIKVRLAKRTLSTAIRLRLTSFAVDDHAENVPTHHVLFSCASQPALPYTSLLPKASRRASFRRKIPHMLPSIAGDESIDLLDVNITSESQDPTHLDIAFGHLHIQFDQSRIASLFVHVKPLLEMHSNPDLIDGIPPLSLNDSTMEMPLGLTDSVLLDLEKARNTFLNQAKKDEELSNRPSIYNFKASVRSLSVCFSNQMDNIMSIALLNAELSGTLAPSSVDVRGSIGNLQVIDLVSSDLLHLKRKDKRYLFQEVFGLAPTELNPPPPVFTFALTQSANEGSIKVEVQQVRFVLSTRFVLKVMHYVCEGPIMELAGQPLRHSVSDARRMSSNPARDVFFSPAMTFDTPHRLQQLSDQSTSAEPVKWNFEMSMCEPYIIVPLHKSPQHATLDLTHGVVLELGQINISWTSDEAQIQTKSLSLRSLHDDFEFIRPVHINMKKTASGITVQVSSIDVQLSEMHAAMLIELYFQGYLPLSLYSQPSQNVNTSDTTSPSSMFNIEFDSVSVSLFTVHSDLEEFQCVDHGLPHGMIFDMFVLLPYETTLISTFTLTGIKLTMKKQHNTAVDLLISQVSLQNTIVSPGCKIQYRHITEKHIHTCWIDSQACILVLDPEYLKRVCIVGLEVMTNIEHTLTRHQNQPISEMASSVYDDVSEYQWTERGRSDSIASSIHVTPPTPLPGVWNIDIQCKMIQIQCQGLTLSGRISCKKDQSQLLVRMQQVKIESQSNILLQPLELSLRYQSKFPLDSGIRQNLAPYHSFIPETLNYFSFQCSVVAISFNLQDFQMVSNTLTTMSSLGNDLERIYKQLRPSTTEVFHHSASTGEEILNTDGLQYSLQMMTEDIAHQSNVRPWQHICIDLPSIQISIEGHATSVLIFHAEPSEFEWIDTPQVKSLSWKWQLYSNYLNNRLLEMEPLLERMTVNFKLWQVMELTPLQLEIKSVDELKINCTFALLETFRLLTRMSMEKELASFVIKNETGVPFSVWTVSGPKVLTTGQEIPLQPSTTVHLRFPEYKELEFLSVELGTRTYRLPSATMGSAVDCVIDISVQHGCKYIVVQSTWLVQNKTATTLQVQLVFPTGGIIPRPPFQCTLQSLESFAIPMSMISFLGTQIYIKPTGIQTWTLVEKPVVACSSTFVVYAMWDENISNRRVLSFCAPLILHNALPMDMDFRLASAPGRYESGRLGVGERCVYHGSEHDTLTLEIRTKGFSWSQATELAPGTISMIDPLNHSVLLVHLDIDTSKASQLEVTLFVPYWILNQSGLELEYQHELAFLGPEHVNPFAAGQALPRSDLLTDSEQLPAPIPVKRKHQLLPSIPPSRGLLDLVPKKVSIASSEAPILAMCHTHQRHGILKIHVRLRGKSQNWSNVISCHISGANGECTIQDNDRTYVVGYVLEYGKGWYDRTQVLTLVPRFVLINALDDFALDILMDENSSNSATLERHAELPWHFTNSSQKKTIRIRFASPGWVWSGALNLHETGDQTLRLRNTVDRTTYLMRISIKLEGPQYRVVFRSSTNVPPYRIENFSLETIRIHQSRVRISDILLPHQTCEYTWDEPLKPHLLVVDMLPSQADDNSRPIRIGIFSMDDIVQFPTKSLAVEVRADGPTRVLRLTDYTPFPKPATKKEPSGWRQYLVAPVVDFQLKLHSISISLVDGKPSELLYVSWNTVGFQVTWTKKMAQLALNVSVHSIQIDNQVRTTRYPVLLNFTESPALEATIVRETTYTSIEFLRYVNVILKPMRWRIDGSLINELAAMFVSDLDEQKSSAPTTEDRLNDFKASTKGLFHLPPEKTVSKKLYFEKFEISPIQATLSFTTSSNPNNNVQMASVRQILQAAGKTLTKIHNAPLHWRSLRWQHVFVPRETVLNQMSLHYQHEAYRQAYVLLGSVDVLGNPVKVFNNLRGGLASFVWEPMQGWQESPQAFGFGIVKGTTLLFRAFVYAILDFNTRIASSMLLGLSDACQRIDTYTGYPVAKTFYQDIAQGASGVVVSPMYSYDLQGWSGIVPGILAGMLGLVLKPMRGFTQGFVNATTSLRDGIQYDIQLYVMRMRPPRYIDPRTHLLSSYSYVHSSGEDIKFNIDQARNEDYVGHVMTAERNQCLLVTKHRVLSLVAHTHPHHSVSYSVIWEVLSDDLILVAYVNPEKIVLYHKPSEINDLVVPTQNIQLPPTQALSVYYMLQQMLPTITNQSDTEQLNVRFVDKCKDSS